MSGSDGFNGGVPDGTLRGNNTSPCFGIRYHNIIVIYF